MTDVRMKSFDIAPGTLEIKAAAPGGTDAGIFEAIVSVFGNVDSVGDKVLAGAFAVSLDEWKASGTPIPVIWSHQWGDPESHIGFVLEAAELLPGDAKLPPDLAELGGLWVRGQLDVDDPTAARAAKVWKLLKGKRVKQFSFAYEITEGAWVEPDEGESFYEIRAAKVHEVGPCLRGANSATELLGVKGELARRGVELTPEAETLLAKTITDAIALAVAVPDAVPSDPSDSKATDPEPPATPDELGNREATPDAARAVDAKTLGVLERELLEALA